MAGAAVDGHFLFWEGHWDMQFELFEKLGSLEGVELYLFLIAAILAVALLVGVVLQRKKHAGAAVHAPVTTRALVYGALCLALSFTLSYFKLFSMPYGGSVTLCSMLPLVMYASCFGPVCGFTAALGYAVLQVIQGAWIVHWAQFVLDYFVAFTCLGLASLVPGNLPLGMAVSGFARMLVSTVSGAIFFADGGLEYGIANPWVYSIAYNGLTVGLDTVICVVVALLPPIKRVYGRLAATARQ